ncbi:hypothetical protein WMY93_025621 [Mugilogobius chulae]|uniref:PB1 domain-containing protein n=1 Tax=Mugilogobius chulae TaxID=88201 RepID=A0AAW0N0W6_9GOBI
MTNFLTVILRPLVVLLRNLSFSKPLLEVAEVHSLPIEVLHENIVLQVKQNHPELDYVDLAENVTYNGFNYRIGMVVAHGSLAGLPEFCEIINMVILQDTLFFILKNLEAWYLEHYRAYCVVFSKSAALKLVGMHELSDQYPLIPYFVGVGTIGKLPPSPASLIAVPLQSKMTGRQAAKLRVILNSDNSVKMFLPTGIPETVEELIDHVRMLCSVEGNFRLQYQDRDFDNALVNLTSTSELNDCSTIKVISLDVPQDSEITSDEISLASSDTEMLSSPSSSVSGRTKMWPRVFVIPTFSYDTELQLEKANEVYKSNMTAFIPSSKTKSDILDRLAEEIFQYKAYPDDFDFSDVAEALVKKHPCLTEPGPYNGAYGWKQRMKTKMGNYRTHLKGIGCSELLANSLKSKRPDDALPAKKVKRPRRGEANHIPDIPNGETAEKLENERLDF